MGRGSLVPDSIIMFEFGPIRAASLAPISRGISVRSAASRSVPTANGSPPLPAT